MTKLRSDLRADLKADLLADLAPAVTDPPAVEPEVVPADPVDGTPVLSLQVTPLRWSRLKVVTVGAGKAVRLGPMTLELNVKP